MGSGTPAALHPSRDGWWQVSERGSKEEVNLERIKVLKSSVKGWRPGGNLEVGSEESHRMRDSLKLVQSLQHPAGCPSAPGVFPLEVQESRRRVKPESW